VVILAALLLAALWFFNRSKSPAHETMQTTSNTGNTAMSSLGDFFKTKLPNGVELNIPQFGIENKLLAFIQDSSKPVDSTTWFNFDRLLFDTGKATLQPSSEEQLNNIAEILKAYPNVHVKIGGYTDNTGDPAANKTLSEARAKTVMDALVSKGIDASRLASEGYGDQYPVGDNSTEEGRAQNRRIALRVTQK
jgi:outer membrane protein OmpA-like peptidoglycan-associated protein